eukprot:SAG31_NODE_1297_length_8934_cov_26.567176_1_plen_126_part_00
MCRTVSINDNLHPLVKPARLSYAAHQSFASPSSSGSSTGESSNHCLMCALTWANRIVQQGAKCCDLFKIRDTCFNSRRSCRFSKRSFCSWVELAFAAASDVRSCILKAASSWRSRALSFPRVSAC